MVLGTDSSTMEASNTTAGAFPNTTQIIPIANIATTQNETTTAIGNNKAHDGDGDGDGYHRNKTITTKLFRETMLLMTLLCTYGVIAVLLRKCDMDFMSEDNVCGYVSATLASIAVPVVMWAPSYYVLPPLLAPNLRRREVKIFAVFAFLYVVNRVLIGAWANHKEFLR